MKKAMVKTGLATVMMFGAVLGHGGVTNAEAVPASSKTQTVMTDNLFKYGLKKDVELPVTVTAGGLSYTLEKIMIFDSKSKDAQALIKKYGYTGTESAKYFIWTKITVENKSGNTVQKSYEDLKEKWVLNFGGDYSAYVTMPLTTVNVANYKPNNNEALWSWSLKPGQKLSTYQAHLYNEDFKEFYVSVNNKGNQNFVEIVKATDK
ncbi:hypothetical protein [Paenibacillus sp. NPDC057934]|uniref:hypothetical protein n=1 Tax=Paenibacillus sp. NPDC057934 TaxID=3346282 RepID=UPI0036DF535B